MKIGIGIGAPVSLTRPGRHGLEPMKPSIGIGAPVSLDRTGTP